MKNSILLTSVLLVTTFLVEAQVKKTAYKSTYYIEKVWSKSQNHLVTLETIHKPSQLVFTQDGVYFKKGGSSKWLYNRWTFDKSEQTSKGYSLDTYFDERDQKIVINYETSEVWYYHGPDPSTDGYNNLTVYTNCIEDKQLIADAERSREASNESSDKFRVDMNYVSIYDNDKGKWSDWKEGDNTFIINANANKDIIHIKASGSEVNYRRTSQNVESKYTSDGKSYQIINAIDDNGNHFQFQLFDDLKLGIKMMYEDVIIQFAKI